MLSPALDPLVLQHRATRVRWLILFLLTCFTLVSYIERINLSVASRFIRDEFGLTDVQMGWSFSAFLIAYTAGQLPAGYLADRFGSRSVLAIAGLLWFSITVAMGIYLGFMASTTAAVLVGLITSRALLGLAEAPTGPASASAVARWLPPDSRGMASAVIASSSYAGDALTLILMSAIVARSGWRVAIFLSAIPAGILALAWWRHARSNPEQHRGVNAAELELIRTRKGALHAAHSSHSAKPRDLVVLSLSYFCQGYVIYLFFFWFYIYLVDVRHFSIAGGGVAGAMPTIAAAACALAGGWLSAFLGRRLGAIPGRQFVIAAAGLFGGGLLVMGAFVNDAWLAVGCFVIAIGTRGLVESAYWGILFELAGERSGSIGGLINMMCNLGGVVSTALSPLLVASFGWPIAICVAAALTASSGLMMYGLETRTVA